MKTLSVSVAAYNMEKLIRENLDSFVNSSVSDDIEILVINDGSKDSTPQIVLEYQEKYPNTVKLINQENAGPGSTVNRGIEHATGKYFRMVDADDWVDVGIEEFVNTLKKIDADMVLANYTEVDDKTKETRLFTVEGVEKNKLLNFEDVCANLSLHMHAVTFKTEILQQNKIRVFNGFYTDLQYFLFPIPYITTIYYIPVNVYMYRVNLGGQSISHESFQRNAHMHTAMINSLFDLYKGIPKEKTTVLSCIGNTIFLTAQREWATLISFAPSPERKRDIYAFLKKFEADCPEVYKEFKKNRGVKNFLLSKGLSYRFTSLRFRKRMGLK